MEDEDVPITFRLWPTLSLPYAVANVVRIIILFTFLNMEAGKRQDAIQDHYSSKEICEACKVQAKENPQHFFEFGKCVYKYGVADDRVNLLGFHLFYYDTRGSMGRYEGFRNDIWHHIGCVELYRKRNGFTSMGNTRFPNSTESLIRRPQPAILGVIMLSIVSTIFDLHLKDFSEAGNNSASSCYVGVAPQDYYYAELWIPACIIPAMFLIQLIIMPLFAWAYSCMEKKLAISIYCGVQALIIVPMTVLVTVEAAYAANAGEKMAITYSMLAWELVYELPLLFFIFGILEYISSSICNLF
eukprot:jgi/Bigna1/78489/fgenesh1_pg.55_\